MSRKILILTLFVMLVLMAAGCGNKLDKYPVLGTKNPSAKLADPPSLAISPAGQAGKQIKIILKYDREMPADKQYYRLLRMSSGTGQFFVEVKRGLHDDFISTMRIGNEYLVYGRFEHDMVAQRNFVYVE
jgi:hypothetical protein